MRVMPVATTTAVAMKGALVMARMEAVVKTLVESAVVEIVAARPMGAAVRGWVPNTTPRAEAVDVTPRRWSCALS